ncbi:MAG: HyaD/HybD family hydrogenase maturation endopeptidase [Thiotrichaceae bacterium]|nr:HyaD/HybD family hydrogenase maturation endopeptidase [Thiotrichaceae bacterium]
MHSFDTLILGIGNILWADEGFGVRAVETLHQQYEFPDNVCLMDGGTQGLYLLQYVQMARNVLILDAVDYGQPAGTLAVAYNEQVPNFMGAKKMSLHQTGFQEVLAAAKLTGKFPESVVLIGIQPETLEDFGGSLTDLVKAQIPVTLERALQELAKWGIVPTPRQQTADALSPESLELSQYEEQRPSEEAACRVGDARVLINRS